MIDELRPHGDGGQRLRLKQPAAGDIYEIDSINLIVGGSSRDKRDLAGAIVKSLLDGEDRRRLAADPSFARTGVIFYSPPTHQPPLFGRYSVAEYHNPMFADASGAAFPQGDFTDEARDHLAAADLIGIDPAAGPDCQIDLVPAVRSVVMSLGEAGLREMYIGNATAPANAIWAARRTLANLRRRRTTLLDEQIPERAEREAPGNPGAGAGLREITRKIAEQQARLVEAEYEVAASLVQGLNEASPAAQAAWLAFDELKENLRLRAYRKQLARQVLDLACGRDGGPIRLKDDTDAGRLWNRTVSSAEAILATLIHEWGGRIEFRNAAAAVRCDLRAIGDNGRSALLANLARERGLLGFPSELEGGSESCFLNQARRIGSAVRTLSARGLHDFLVVVDQGDMLLDPAWQGKYLDMLQQWLACLRRRHDLGAMQLIVTSNSPLVTTDVLRGAVTQLGATDRTLSFGGSIHEVINYTYGTRSVGDIAWRTVRWLDEEAQWTDAHWRVAAEIDDEFIRTHLEKRRRA